jgi:hypothetical protein
MSVQRLVSFEAPPVVAAVNYDNRTVYSFRHIGTVGLRARLRPEELNECPYAGFRVHPQPMMRGNRKMAALKFMLVGFVTVCGLLVFTYFWVATQSRGSKATTLSGLSVLTLHSPLYWLLVAAILTGSWWLSRHWLF